jgi:hypothetical protein
VAIRAGILGSKQAVKKAAAKGGGGDFAQILKGDGDTWKVRFLIEPENWLEYFEHYYDGKYVVCDDEVCPACDDGVRRSQRFLVPVLMVDDSKVACIKLAKTAYSALERKYQRYDTMTDRDYEITRHGTGQNDTEYEVEPGDPIKVNLSRFKPPSPHKTWEAYVFSFIKAMVDSAANADIDDDDDEEDEETPAVKKRPVAAKATVKKTIAAKKPSTNVIRRSR